MTTDGIVLTESDAEELQRWVTQAKFCSGGLEVILKNWMDPYSEGYVVIGEAEMLPIRLAECFKALMRIKEVLERNCGPNPQGKSKSKKVATKQPPAPKSEG